MGDREGTTVRVVRNRFEPSKISIEIPRSDPVVITVLKVPSLRLVAEPVRGDRFDYDVRESTGNFDRDLCVHAPAGSILIPNSFRVLYDSKEGARVTFKEGTITQDPFNACQFVGGSWDTMYKSRAKLNAQAVAEVLKPKPIPQALQSATFTIANLLDQAGRLFSLRQCLKCLALQLYGSTASWQSR